MKKLVFNFKSKITKKFKYPKNILGGKGANLAEMGRLGLPVPPGFTITTEVCDLFYKNKKKLPKKVILSIVDKFLVKLQAQLDERGIELIYSNKVINWIAEEGYDKVMGARPMERFITENIKKPLVDSILFRSDKKGHQIKVDFKDGKAVFTSPKKSAKVT